MAENIHPSEAFSISRLRWRCRRGMRELDVILSAWLDQRFEQSGLTLQSAFVALLECEDDRLWVWLTGRSDPDDPNLLTLVRLLRKDELASD